MKLLQSLTNFSNFLLEATKELCMKLVLGLCLFSGYVVVSLIVYAAMRHFLVPQKTHVLPVHLMFHPSCKGSTALPVHDFVGPFKFPTDSLQHCTYPFAEFYLADGQRLLSPGHVYSVAVELDLPESPENDQIGMFMVNLTLYSYSGTVAVTSIRPAILHYKSSLLRTLSTIFYSFPLVLGLMEEKQRQEIIMLENYQEPYTEGTVYARVTIMSHQIQLYNVELTLDAVFSGLSYYLYHWPISMSVIIVSGIFFTLSMVTLLTWLRRVLERIKQIRLGRRHSSLRMTIQPSGLDPIPEEQEEEQGREANNPPVEDVSSSDTRTDIMDTGSTISSVTEVTISSDLSELDNNLQNLREQLSPEHSSSRAVGSEDKSGNSTPLVTALEDGEDSESVLRHRTT